jgi:hypothetical protein
MVQLGPTKKKGVSPLMRGSSKYPTAHDGLRTVRYASPVLDNTDKRVPKPFADCQHKGHNSKILVGRTGTDWMRQADRRRAYGFINPKAA